MPAQEHSRTVVLSVSGGTRAHSATERSVLDDWVAAEHPTASVVDAAASRALLTHLSRADTVVSPVRVAWVPPDRGGSRPRLADALSTVALRRPWALLQPHLLRASPGAAHVVAGEPATVAELRSSFAAERGSTPGTDEEFASFVLRRAGLACDRAERRIVGDRYKVPRLMVEQITATARFAAVVEGLVETTGQARAEVDGGLRSCLAEMIAVQSPIAIDAFRAVMSPMHRRAWDVDVDTAGLERLRALNREQPLVFLPSHRSYSDPLLFADTLHNHDFPRNHLLGGKNLAFWPIGPLGRRAGVVFIRRSFGDDHLYKAAMREYLGHLMAKRFNLEWYIEGGRTRTGKLRRPRYGLLRYLVDALADRPEVDPVLVPVSIVYDQLHEVGAMAAEQRGAVKKAEGLSWLARYVRDQQVNLGRAQVRFGEPIPLRAALADAGTGRAQLEKVAFRVCVGINRVTPVTATSLVTFALLSTRDRALTLDQVRDVVSPLVDYLEQRSVAAPLEDLRSAAGLRGTLDRLIAANVASCFDGGSEPVFSIEPGRHHVAAFYRNGVLHHLVNRAIAEVATLRAGTAVPGSDPVSVGWTELVRLRDLLKFEFFFPDKRVFGEELLAEVDLIDPAWRSRAAEPAGAYESLRAAPVLLAHGTLRSILDAQLVVAEQLCAHDPTTPVDRTAFLEECLGVGRQMLLQHRLDRADSVSGELYTAALRLADNRSLVEPGPDLPDRRRAHRDEVRATIEDLDRIGRLDAERLEEVLRDGGRRDRAGDPAPRRVGGVR